MAINYGTLFGHLGKIINAQKVLNTARLTTFPPEIKDVLDAFNNTGLNYKKAIAGLESADSSYSSGGNSAMTSLRTAAINVLIQTVNDDTPLVTLSLYEALRELIRQMVADSETIKFNVVAASATPRAGNTGNGVIRAGAKGPDGQVLQYTLPETIIARAQSADAFDFTGKPVVSPKTSEKWPGGSGIKATVNVARASTGLVPNGSFDTESETVPDTPADWRIEIGSAGVSVLLTDYEAQRVVITGTPSAGYYRLKWANSGGFVQTTDPIAFDAAGDTVQAELRKLIGLEAVTVDTTGTGPDFTHDIIFVGRPGNVAQITVDNQTTGGTITPSTVSNGSPIVLRNRALVIVGDSAELTELYVPVQLSPLTVYGWNVWAAVDVVPAAGVLSLGLYNGIGGTPVEDSGGAANTTTISLPGLTTSLAATGGFFVTPKVINTVTYMRLKLTTALSSGSKLILDELVLAPATQLYPQGPFVLPVEGGTDFYAGSDSIPPDTFDVAITNTFGGQFQQWFERNFDMSALGLVIPNVGLSAETISDSLIS